MTNIKSHRDLLVWQKSMDLAVDVYKLVATFPRDERYRLVDQICRSVSSVAANIAEGHARSTRRDYAHFLAIAQGSLAETETFLLLAKRLGFTNDGIEDILASIDAIGRMLSALRARLSPFTKQSPAPASLTPNP